MARKRMIDPSIWTDDGMAELAPRQQLLYIGLFSNADDDGRLKGSLTAIRLMLPGVYGGVDLDEIATDLDRVLESMTQIRRYSVNERDYLVFENFRTWQKIDRPQDSVLPPPPDPSSNNHRPFDEHSTNDPGALVPNRREENRKEQKGTEADALTRSRPVLRDFGITDEQIDKSLQLAPPIDFEDLPFMAESFVEYHRANKTKVKSPYQRWLTWLKKDREFRERDAPVRNGGSSTNGKLVADTDEWLNEQWEEARRYG